MNDADKLDYLYQLWYLMDQTGLLTHRLRYRELHETGNRPKQIGILVAIWSLGNQATAAEISRWLSLADHSVSSVLDTMEERGLVKRVKDLDRKNWARLAITEKGERSLKQAMNKRESVVQIFSCLSEEEQHQLESLLIKIWDNTRRKLGMKVDKPFRRIRTTLEETPLARQEMF